jgi:ABC-type iron transport system FetAB permease component
MNLPALVSIITALILNFAAYHFSLDYFWSVILVFGGMTTLFSINAIRQFTINNWKLFSGFFLFSNIKIFQIICFAI